MFPGCASVGSHGIPSFPPFMGPLVHPTNCDFFSFFGGGVGGGWGGGVRGRGEEGVRRGEEGGGDEGWRGGGGGVFRPFPENTWR